MSVKDDSHWLLHAHYFPPLIRSATVRKSVSVLQSVRIFLAKGRELNFLLYGPDRP